MNYHHSTTETQKIKIFLQLFLQKTELFFTDFAQI